MIARDDGPKNNAEKSEEQLTEGRRGAPRVKPDLQQLAQRDAQDEGYEEAERRPSRNSPPAKADQATAAAALKRCADFGMRRRCSGSE
jgi:hypothetical protein